MKFELLERFREEQFYRRIGSSFVGLFAIGLSLSKFKLGQISAILHHIAHTFRPCFNLLQLV